MLCAIWYHLYNLKNVKNTHGGVLLLVKLFSRFLNYASGTKSRKVSHVKLWCNTFNVLLLGSTLISIKIEMIRHFWSKLYFVSSFFATLGIFSNVTVDFYVLSGNFFIFRVIASSIHALSVC